MCNKVTNVEVSDIFKVSAKYSLPTRMNAWFDEDAVKSEKIHNTLYKRDKCLLLVSKTKTMLANVLGITELSTAIESLTYGSLYQIKAPELPNTVQPIRPQTKGLVLSALMTDKDLNFGMNFMHGCGITGSPDHSSTHRNSFRLINPSGWGGNVCYGDDLYIQLYKSEKTMPDLYLQAECSTIDTFGTPLNLRLSTQLDIYCHFQIVHYKQTSRKDAIGSPVVPNVPLIIQHLASGQNMSCLNSNWIPTFFGPECIVTCKTITEPNRTVTVQNIWKIIGKSDHDAAALIAAARGENIPIDSIQ